MDELIIEIDGKQLLLTKGDRAPDIALPFDPRQQANPEQWLTNFRRQLRYACDNVGWPPDGEVQEMIVEQVLANPEVRAFIGNREGDVRMEALQSSENTPGEPTENAEPVAETVTNKPAETVSVNNKSPWLFLLLGLIVLVTIGYFILPNKTNDAYEPSDDVEEMIEDATILLGECLAINGDQSVSLNSIMTQDEYLMINYPFKRALRKVVKDEALTDRKAINAAALEIMKVNLIKWAYRCDCELTIVDCLEVE